MSIDTVAAFVDALAQFRLLEPAQLDEAKQTLRGQFTDPRAVARELIKRGWLTPYQLNQLFQGRGQDLVLGSYVLLERIGEGGMGQVFRARHLKLGRIVAVKLIRKERLAKPEAVRRFQREILAAAQLSHPNIVAAYDADEVNDTNFMVMEYVDGMDLAKIIKQKGPLPAAEACNYMRQAALGLQHAYERGMIHRDIKPANLLLTSKTYVVKILDMGLARLNRGVEDNEGSSIVTQEGMVMGTPDYIAPEQAQESHSVDIRADLYSLGCTFHYLLTGQVPFPGGTLIQKLNKHQFEMARPVEQLRPEISSAVGGVVRKLMAKRPEDRFQTPAELAAALVALMRQGLLKPAGASAAAGDLAYAAQPLPAMPSMVDQRITPAERTTGDTASDWSSFVAPPVTPSRGSSDSLTRKPQERNRVILIAGGTVAAVVVVLYLVILAWSARSKATRGGESGGLAVKIEANKPWQDTGVEVNAGESVLIQARGDWKRGDSLTSAKGLVEAAGDQTVVPDAPLMCLLARVGNADPVPVGVSRVIVAPQSGRLYVQANDLELEQNSGRLQLSIEGGTPDSSAAPSPAPTRIQIAAAALKPLAVKAAESKDHEATWGELIRFRMEYAGTPQYAQAARLIAKLPSPLDVLNAKQIPATERLAGQPAELVAVLGEHRGWHGSILTGLGYSPDGKLIASAGYDRNIHLWDADTLRLRGSIKGTFAAFGRDGKTLTVSGEGIHLYDCSEPEPEEKAFFGKEMGATNAIAYSADGKAVAVLAGGGTIYLWDMSEEEPKQQAKIAVPNSQAKVIALSPDKMTVAAGTDDHMLYVWDVSGQMPEERAAIKASDDWVTGIAFSPDGKILATVGEWDFSVRLYDMTERIPKQKGYANPGAATDTLTFSPDGKTLAVGTWDNRAILYDITTANPTVKTTIRANGEQVWALAFSPDNKKLAAGGGDMTVRTWDLNGPEPRTSITPKGHGWRVKGVSFSGDCKRLASAGYDGVVRIWDAVTGKELRALSCDRPWLTDVAFSPDDKLLATADSQDGGVKIWDASSWQAQAGIRGGREGTSAIAFGPDGHMLAVAWSNRSVTIFDPLTGDKRFESPSSFSGPIYALSLAPDQKAVAAAGEDQTVKIWDLPSGKERAVLRGHTKKVKSIAYAPAGQTLVSASEDGAVQLWNTTTGKERTTLQSQEGVDAIAISPDGSMLVSAGTSGLMTQWKLPDGEKLREWRVPDRIERMTFALDGRHLATANDSGTVYIFRITPVEQFKK